MLKLKWKYALFHLEPSPEFPKPSFSVDFDFLQPIHLRFTISNSNPINPDTNSFRDFVHFLGSTRTWSFPLSTYKSNEFGLPYITCCFVASCFRFQADCQFSTLYSSPVIVFNIIGLGLLILKVHPSKAVG